ncbi:hydroxyacid dehydrogenase [Pseudomonas syringae group sp. J309-1]|uniref:hydroxyacid dehydrogenase n=1 Tax=Pseudomonas syringae group sp. J309-1 TaxID=3079588 RepID=UPI00290E7C4A|nr:hydroxyacid dehydrogenase [Pseudomonas syringae group sp. J309-1]MDU8360083.1 hydroxyacid dehydrogenase [Pseudomonas syringae group sp. J309-1]
MTYTILVTAERLAPAGLDILTQRGCRVLFVRAGHEVADIERLMASEPIDAVISRTFELSEQAIAACPTLKVISKHGVGVSNIHVAAASARGIPVYVTPGANAQSVCEMTLGLMFAAARKVSWMDSEIRAGRWSRAQDGLELSGRTLGLVGFGQVARKVATVCQALGMPVRVYDPFLKDDSDLQGAVAVDSLAALLSESHVLSLHVPLTAQTANLIGAAELAMLPVGAVLINTARGEVVDEAALVDALRSGQLYAAGLDTMAIEPLPSNSPLLHLDNVVLTPHVGGSTPAALAAMARDAATNVLGFLDGKPVPRTSCVNADLLSL